MASLATSPAHRSSARRAARKTASIAAAKEHLSSLIRTVESKRTEIVLERRGVPVAKLIPMPVEQPATGFGWMKGSATIFGDIDGPTGEEWRAAGEK